MKRVDIPLVVFSEPQVVLEFLVRGDAPDEEDVCQPVPQHAFECGAGRGLGEPRRVYGDRKHGGLREPDGREFLSIVFGVAQRQVDPFGQAGQLLASPGHQRDEPGVVAGEKMRRGDVVILDDPPGRQGSERLAHR